MRTLRALPLLFATILTAASGCARTDVRELDPTGGLSWDGSVATDGPVAFDGSFDGSVAPDGGQRDSGFGPRDGSTGAKLSLLLVDPPLVTLPVGGRQRYTAIALYDDGTREDVSLGASWSVSSDVAFFTGSIANATAPGEATVVATFDGLRATAALTVSAARVVALEVTPAFQIAAAGVELSFVATASFDDGSRADLTGSVAWSSSDLGVLTIAPGGFARTSSPGQAVVTATFEGLTATALVQVSGARLVNVQVEPVDPTMNVGQTLAFHAIGFFSDGSSGDVTSSVVWSSSNEAAVTIDAAGLASAHAAGTAVITADLNGTSAVSAVTVLEAQIRSLELAPPSSVLAIGASVQLVATATFDDGTSRDVTASVTFVSSDPSTAVVANAPGAPGLVTAVASGTVEITAVLLGLEARAQVVVSPALLTALRIVPASATIAVGSTLQLQAIGAYDDGTTRDVTTSVTWMSDPTIASVSRAGLVSGVSPGTTRVIATLDGQTAIMTLVVDVGQLVGIDVTPANGSVALGGTLAYRATGRYASGVTADLTEQATWTTTDTTIATVSNVAGSRGAVLGRSAGTTRVIATFLGVTGAATITVAGPSLSNITVTPANRTVPSGTVLQYTATASYADGTTRNVTSLVTWASQANAVATITAAGTATARGAGTTLVSATYQGVTGSTNLTVAEANPVQLQISPINPRLIVGATQIFQAVVIYSDGTSQNVTNSATWSSSDTSVATIGGGGGGPGGGRSLARAVAPGTATITATAMGLTGTTVVTVTEATLVSITVTPAAFTLVVGGQRQLAATAIYSDGSSRTITGQATWTSSNPMVAQVTSGRGRGNVTAIAPGSATITATYQGLSGAAALVVSAATLTSIQVTPFNPSVAVGEVVQLQAVAIFSDGSSQNVTNQATWTSSDPSVAVPSNTGGGPGGGNRGLTTTLAAGTAVISASYQGLFGSTTLTVTSATIVQIQVTPFAPTVPAGYGVQMRATAIFSDMTFRDVTNLATWTSSNPMIAGVSSAGMTRGQVTTLSAGTVTISAQYQMATGSTLVTVTNETLQNIDITPPMVTVLAMGSVQLTATGHFSGGTNLDLTELVTWQSSDPTIADVSNAVGSHGLATAFRSGTVTITARRGNVTGMAALNVP